MRVWGSRSLPSVLCLCCLEFNPFPHTSEMGQVPILILLCNLDAFMGNVGPEKAISYKAKQTEVWKKQPGKDDRPPWQHSHQLVFVKAPEAGGFQAEKSFELWLNWLPSVLPKHHIGLFSPRVCLEQPGQGKLQNHFIPLSVYSSYNEKPRYRKWHFQYIWDFFLMMKMRIDESMLYFLGWTFIKTWI